MSKLSRFIVREYKKEFSRYTKSQDYESEEPATIRSLRSYFFNRCDAEQIIVKGEFQAMLKKRLAEKYQKGIGWKKYAGLAGLAASVAGVSAVAGSIAFSEPAPERWQLVTGISSVVLACYSTSYHETHVLKPEKFQERAEAKLEKKIRRFDANWKTAFEKAEPKLREMLEYHGCYKAMKGLYDALAAKSQPTAPQP